MTTLYEKDFFEWTREQVHLLKEMKINEVDVKNLIEEILSLGNKDKREINNHMINLFTHLLKLKYQPEGQGNSNSWNASIRNAKREIIRLLKDSPSLKNHLWIEENYKYAREDAAEETKLPMSVFPEECPWSIEEILKEIE